MFNFQNVLSFSLATFLALGLLNLNSVPVQAEETKIEVSDPNALKSALEKLSGKSVTLRLSSGEDLGGVLEAVGPSAIRLGQLTGKEFYSAIVQLSEVSAVIYRAK